MKKLTKLLALSGLALSLLVGCNANGGNGGKDKPGEGDVVKTLEGLEITAQPTKTSYYQGEEFDPAGLAVSAVYNTGKEALDSQAYTLSGFDSSTAGQKTITVTYEGKTQTITVNVIGKNGLSIDKEPEKYYVVGDELDLEGLVVNAFYSDETANQITDYEVDEVDMSSPSESLPVYVRYGDFYDVFYISVAIKKSGKQIVEIYATNDFHGQIEEQSGRSSLTQLMSYLKAKSDNPNTLLLDQGDTWQGSIYSNSNRGKMMTDVMNYVRYILLRCYVLKHPLPSQNRDCQPF